MPKIFNSVVTSLSIGFFLAVRDIRRSNIWTTILIILVMILTFLNLVVISGVLVGLIEGSETGYTERYSGNVFITTLNKKRYIEHSQDIINVVSALPEVQSVSVRYTDSIQIEANYRDRKRESDRIDSAGAIAAGIDPVVEDKIVHLSKYVINGSYLLPDDYDQILIGADLLYKYSPIDSASMPNLKNVDVGSKVRLVINGVRHEVTIKGVVKTKVGDIDQRIFMISSELRTLIGRDDFNVGEIAIKLKPGNTPETVRDEILATGAGTYAKVQTASEAEPKFVKDIKATFAILGNLIGFIGLIVASITIFIVIFVNAITRRRYIGILKGIGISSLAIEVSYMIQSLFYASCGMIVGSVFVFGFLQPYIANHPINFPFSDGILVATVSGTLIRVLILMIATVIAGYIPARIVVKQNTLDAILGR